MEMWLSTRTGPRQPPLTSTVALPDDGPGDVASFVAGLSDGVRYGIGVDEAAHHCAIIAAAYRSAAEGRPVAVTT
jgi:hypothetical protein